MTVYNINKGIGWASSGVEYAQYYRADSFRKIGVEAKFVFTDFISADNIADLTENMGFKDDEIEWLYTAFTDFKIKPSNFKLEDLEKTFARKPIKVEHNINTVKYYFADNDWALAFLKKNSTELVNRVELVVNNNLIRKDYYSSGRFMTEYYAPVNNKATLYQRSFFNTDGTVAYDEIMDDDNSHLYKFKHKILYSDEELFAYYLQQLNLSAKDIILIDRATGLAQQILENKGQAKVGTIVHADHFSEPNTNNEHILWNNYYEYEFQHYRDVDFYVTATEAQKRLLAQQFQHYLHVAPKIYAIPVGSIDKLQYPDRPRRPFSMITASRLASEKHIDWLIEAVVAAHNNLSELNLDIYGEGGERNKLNDLINKYNAQNYIRLMGHQDLSDVYQRYQVYLAGSTSEGFGLTLLEAIGSGLAMIGLDVRYGNQTFIENNKNGILIDYQTSEDTNVVIASLTKAIKNIFKVNLDEYSAVSYDLAKEFLTTEVANKWKRLIESEQSND